MPNCDFYAGVEDHEALLDWLFAEATCHVYELASDFEQPLKRFESSREVLSQFERRYPDGSVWHRVCLQLYVLSAGPPFSARRVSLDPAVCGGAETWAPVTGVEPGPEAWDFAAVTAFSSRLNRQIRKRAVGR